MNTGERIPLKIVRVHSIVFNNMYVYYNNSCYLCITETIFEELNQLAQGETFLPTRKLNELKQSHPYRIQGVKSVKTKYGERIILILQEFQIFLPDRFRKMTTAQKDALNDGSWEVTYNGDEKLDNGFRRHKLAFLKSQ